MSATFDDYNAAVEAFWTGRDLQTQKQIDSGRIDTGTRGAVTGGKHMAALHEVIAKQFEPLVELGAVVRSSGAVTLPGFYRPAKNWDIVVTYRGILVAAIECKSQVGSVGNNFNNRTEEMIGLATDFWHAYDAGFVGRERPWLGFVFVMEHSPNATKSVRNSVKSIYPTDLAFMDSSYPDRYRILFQRMVQEQLYDAACLVSTVKGAGIHSEGLSDVSTRNFTAAIAARVEYIRGII